MKSFRLSKYVMLFLCITAFSGSGATANTNRPNILLVLVDDMGWADLGCYGSEIRTPNIDALATNGLRFRQFYNGAKCSPSRASLLTGLYPQQVAVDTAASLPTLRTNNNITIAESLRAHGYRTYMAGKWHLGSNVVGQRTYDRGFMHVFGTGSDTSGAGGDYWRVGDYNLVSPSNEIPKRTYGAGSFYHTDAVVDHALDFLDHHLKKADGVPFFIYLPFQAPHFDLQAPKALADTYLSIYSNGWDVIRQQRYDRMVAQGIIDPARYLLTPKGDVKSDPFTPVEPILAWNTLSAEPGRQPDLVRRMALYATMIDKVDQNLGRLVARLKQSGLFNNTLIFFLSDNGGNAEGGLVRQNWRCEQRSAANWGRTRQHGTGWTALCVARRWLGECKQHTVPPLQTLHSRGRRAHTISCPLA